VVTTNDMRKQQSTTTNFYLPFVLSYITSMNEGHRLLIYMVVMVKETVMVDDLHKPTGHGVWIEKR
jgi:hypothetical protein